VAGEEHDERAKAVATIRPPQTPRVILRTLDNRSFREIPPSEFA
jgi:hypothetical protein